MELTADAIEFHFEHHAEPFPLKERTIVISGATSGIGLALACQLAHHGPRLVLLGRRRERLELIQRTLTRLAPAVQIETLCADVTQADLGRLLPSSTDILVNNAGLALGRAPGHTAAWSDWERMIEVNLTGLVRATHAVLPNMVARGSGHIMSVCSIAGHQAYAGGSIYCATKHAVRAFHQSLRQELHAHNVRLSLVSPGMVETEFSLVRFGGDADAARAVYKGMVPLSADDIARQIVHMLVQPGHVNIDEMTLMPTCQGAATVVHRG